MPLRRLKGPIDIREERDDRNPASLLLYSPSYFYLSFFCVVCIFPLTLSVPPSFTFSLSVITVIFPLTGSDYTQPPLAITFYFKSTQPPDLPRFRLLFGSTVVIKMLPGSQSLLSKVSFLPHHAIAIQHFSPAFPYPLPTHFLISPFPLSLPLLFFSHFALHVLIVSFCHSCCLFCLHVSRSPASSGCFNNCRINTSRHYLNTQFVAG